MTRRASARFSGTDKHDSSLVESFSGVRGIFGSSITEETASHYALAYLYTLVAGWKKKSVMALFRENAGSGKKSPPLIVIGHDSRPSSEKVYKAILSSLKGFSRIVYLGLASTPAVEFMVRHLRADGGIIITASHNPPEFSGWKFLSHDGSVLPRSRMALVIKNYHSLPSEKMLSSLSSSLSASRSASKSARSVQKVSSVRPYVSFLLSLLPPADISLIKKKRFKIVFDANGGAAIPYLKLFSSRLNLESRIIGSKAGSFHRIIEPTAESLAPLSGMLDNDSFGVGFDCDADRAELVLPSGRKNSASVLSGNHLLALAVMSVLEFHRHPSKQTVVVNDATSDMVREIVKHYKARVVEVEVGEANVVAKMLEKKSIVGGEGSSAGAIIFPSRCRDGLLGLLFILRLLARKDISLKQAVSLLPSYYTLRANVRLSPPQNINARLKKLLLEDGASVTSRGGPSGSIKARFEHGFVWFRASKTEPSLFRIIADSKSRATARKLLSYGKRILMEAAT